MCIGLHVKYRLFLSEDKLEFSQHIFEKYANIKFHEIPSIGSRDVPYGKTDGRIDRYDEANGPF